MMIVCVALSLEPTMFLPALEFFQADPGNWSERGISAQCDRHLRGSEERQTEKRVLDSGPTQQGNSLAQREGQKRQETDL